MKIRIDDTNRWKAIKKIVYILLVLFVVDVLLFLTMIPITFYTGVLLLVQLVVVIYFTAISLGLLKRLENPDTDDF